MSLFPWESATQASQSFARSTRIPSGPLAGRYQQHNISPRKYEPYQKKPQPPQPITGGHPKGKREWEQYQERTLPTNLPPRDIGREPILAQPLSSAHSRLLPAGRSVSLQIMDDPSKSQRMNVPRRKDQGPKLLRPDPTERPPTLMTRLDRRGDFRTYEKDPKTYVAKPNYDPVLHKFNQNKKPWFDRAEQLKKTGQSIPERLGARHTIVPVFTKQVEKRENSKIVPDAARGTSVYGYRTHEGADFLDFKKFHCQGTYLSSNKGYSQSRHYNLSGSNTKGLVQGDSGHPGQDFAIHQMDHMKRALGQDGTKVFDEHAFGEKDIIPDGQRNEFEITNKDGTTKSGLVTDWAVSSDAPEWIVAQARRSGVNSVLERDNDFAPDDGQVNEFAVVGGTGMQSDWAISGDAPDWITSNVSKYDKTAVIHRPQKSKGVKSSFIDDKGQEICDSTVSGDAPHFMVETNRRIDDKMVIMPPKHKQPWHNTDSPRKMRGMHASIQSTETYDEPKGGVRTDYQQDYGRDASKDTPYFIGASTKRVKQQGSENPTERTRKKRYSITKATIQKQRNKKGIARGPAGAPGTGRASWDNRNVMGGCHGKVTLREKNDYASAVAGI